MTHYSCEITNLPRHRDRRGGNIMNSGNLSPIVRIVPDERVRLKSETPMKKFRSKHHRTQPQHKILVEITNHLAK